MPDTPSPLFEFLLRQGDSALVLGHRTSEWCGLAPAIEEDIALANIALDLIGQAKLWLEYAGEEEGAGRTANDLAFLRDAYDFRNLLMLELPNEDFGRTIMRHFFYDAFQVPWLEALSASSDERVSHIAQKAAKEAIYHYTRHYAKKLNSKLLMANAWHSRTDALSSVAVLVGLIGVTLDVIWLDAAAALVVALLIAKIALSLLWDSMQELVDTALPEEKVSAIRKAALNVPDLRDVHHIRTRTMGGKTLIDLHLQVDPRVSVSEGHEIGCWVASNIRAESPDVLDITFHIDSEDDADVDQDGPPFLRPLRGEVRQALEQDWKGLCEIQDLRLHYLGGKIDVEVLTSSGVEVADLKLASARPWLGQISILRPHR